jgi:aldehyde dehydrogenase
MNDVEYFRTYAVAFRATCGNFIGGQWVAAKSGRTLENTSPISGETICTVARSEAADIEAALDAAHAARTTWAIPRSRPAP